MALSLSKERTVLWDQVEYSGDPKDFAWVLPVGEGAYIEASTDAFFEALEAVSATHVSSPVLVCNGREVRQQERAGCGGSPAAPVDAKSASAKDDEMRQGSVRGVVVEHEGTVGPYETATLKANDPQALRTWLLQNGYAIPKDIDPVIDAYVAEGASFIVLRLKPGAGVRQMTPVRVITPGASPILPLRMVAAGTGSSVSIVLYVIAEGRYAVKDKPAASIDFASLTWDWSKSSSNYADLREAELADGAYLTSFSLPKGFTSTVTTSESTPAEYEVVDTAKGLTETYDNLTDLYFGRASSNENEANPCQGVASLLRSLDSAALVVEKCDGSPDCEPPPAGAVTSEKLECGGFTDISTALIGAHPADVWVTRIEATLPRSALATDLTLAATTQEPQKNWHVATTNLNPPCNPATGEVDNGTNPSGNGSASDADADGSSSMGCSMKKPLFPGAMLGATSLCALMLVLRRAAGRGGRRRRFISR